MEKDITQFKISNPKSSQTIPKDMFPKLLRQLLEQLDTTSECLKSGFRKCEIHPINSSPVLSRLPNDRPQNDINTSIGKSFLKELKRLWHVDDTNNPSKRRKRSKINVKPGKSVTVGDIDNITQPYLSVVVPKSILSEDESLLVKNKLSHENEITFHWAYVCIPN